MHQINGTPTMALQIPSILPFNPHGDQNSGSQRYGKKQFQFLILASGVSDDAGQNALLLHMVWAKKHKTYMTH